MIVVVSGSVIVAAPVIVAALVRWNDVVGVADAVADHGPPAGAADTAGMLHFQKLDESYDDGVGCSSASSRC